MREIFPKLERIPKVGSYFQSWKPKKWLNEKKPLINQ